MARRPTTKNHISLLLPGSSTTAQWRDFLQSRRQFWPTLTTRHASLVPLCANALQRERRQMQSKHLWYIIDISWQELDKKLQVLAPTELTCEQIWQHLFLTKHRQNPFVEGRYKEADYKEVEKKWQATKKYFQDYKRFTCPFSVITWKLLSVAYIDNIAAQKAIDESKALHARRWQTKEGTYRIKKHVLSDVCDGRDVFEDAGASTSDAVHYSQDWADDYYMGH